MIALALAMFMAAMEATVVATAMPSVVADLHGIEVYGWVGATYMLASTVSATITAPMRRLTSRRRGRAPLAFTVDKTSLLDGLRLVRQHASYYNED